MLNEGNVFPFIEILLQHPNVFLVCSFPCHFDFKDIEKTSLAWLLNAHDSATIDFMQL